MGNVSLTSPDGKPPLGGWLPSIRFTEPQTSVLNAAADQLIPGGGGFPNPSEVDVISFIAKYVTPSGREAKWYPFLAEDDFKVRLEALGDEFVRATSARRVQVLQALERDEAEFFGRLRDIVYHAYYSRPEVIRAMNRNLAAAKDYRNTPQPYGYSDVMDDWDDELLSRVRGSYKRTEDVKPVVVPADLPRTTGTRQAHVPLETAEPQPTPSGG
jgi:hypothetical protein